MGKTKRGHAHMKTSRNHASPRRVTSIEVARRAGVSQSTVSRAFSANGNVAPETLAQILKVARKLGYRPNAIARSLITRHTDIVGIVMAQITSPFYPYVLELLTQRLHEIGRRVLLFTTGPQQEMDDILPQVLEYQVDGLIITSATLSSATVNECVRHGTPVVLFNRYVQGTYASAVCCDNEAGGRLVADLLLDASHRRLAYITGKVNTSTNLDREKGFGERLRERGVKTWLREVGHYTYESGFEAAHRLLQRAAPPDAIFAANDITAMGTIDAARELGVKIPDDVSIIGFDIPAANWSAYSLTTIWQPVEAMIEQTLELLLERRDTPDSRPVLKFIPGELVKRNSARLADRTDPA